MNEQIFNQIERQDQKLPNIFAYATNELSQDAFLCWLFEWGQQNYQGTFLYQKARELLKRFGIEVTEKTQIDVIKKQYKHIDVLLLLKNPKKAVIIEDKVYSAEHGDQIKKYAEALSEEGEYSKEEILTVYLKTANFIGKNRNAQITIGRQDILDVLGKEGCGNNIFDEFIEHLLRLNEKTDEWKNEEKPVRWSYRAWEGFLMEYSGENGGMGYVPNPSGGFLAYWFSWEDINNQHDEIYKQIEILPNKRLKLCYKINFNNKERYNANLVKELQAELLKEHADLKLGNRSGRTSTYAYKKINLDEISKDECIKMVDAFIKG